MSKLSQLREQVSKNLKEIYKLKQQQGYYLIIGKFDATAGDTLNNIFNLINKKRPQDSKLPSKEYDLKQNSHFIQDGAYSQYIFKILMHKNNDVIDNSPTDLNNPNNMSQSMNHAPTKDSRWIKMAYKDLIKYSRNIKYLTWCKEDAQHILKLVPNAYLLPFSQTDLKFNQQSIKHYLSEVWDYLVGHQDSRKTKEKFMKIINTKKHRIDS